MNRAIIPVLATCTPPRDRAYSVSTKVYLSLFTFSLQRHTQKPSWYKVTATYVPCMAVLQDSKTIPLLVELPIIFNLA